MPIGGAGSLYHNCREQALSIFTNRLSMKRVKAISRQLSFYPIVRVPNVP